MTVAPQLAMHLRTVRYHTLPYRTRTPFTHTVPHTAHTKHQIILTFRILLIHRNPSDALAPYNPSNSSGHSNPSRYPDQLGQPNLLLSLIFLMLLILQICLIC